MTCSTPVRFTLHATRTYPKGRPCEFDAESRVVTVTRKKLVESYSVSEFAPDREPTEEPARAFEVVKQSSGEVYHCLVAGPGRHTCDCAGFSYEASVKANELAWARGEPIYYTAGCVHLDFLLHLVWENLLPEDES